MGFIPFTSAIYVARRPHVFEGIPKTFRNRVVGSLGVSPTTSVILLGIPLMKKIVFGVRPFLLYHSGQWIPFPTACSGLWKHGTPFGWQRDTKRKATFMCHTSSHSPFCFGSRRQAADLLRGDPRGRAALQGENPRGQWESRRKLSAFRESLALEKGSLQKEADRDRYLYLYCQTD